MILKKKAKTFNDYTVEISWGQLEAIVQALEASHAEVIADELLEELKWYLERVPGPGEEEEDAKAREEGAAAGEEEFPIPMPPGQETATAGVPGEEAGPESGATPLSGTEKEALAGGDENTPDDQLPDLPREGGEEGGALPDLSDEGAPPPEEETDRRLPLPPRE